MPRADKESHLNSNEHKNNRTEQRRVWCEDCSKYISDTTRHFQSESHLRNQQNTQSAFSNVRLGNGVEIIVKENTYIKLKVNPTENLEYRINEIISKRYFPRFKYQIRYLARFTKKVNGEEQVFKRWVQSELTYNHMRSTFGMQQDVHNILMQKLDDEQLEGSGLQFQEIEEVILQIYKIKYIQDSSWVELPPKYKNSQSIINIKNDDQFCFLWCI